MNEKMEIYIKNKMVLFIPSPIETSLYYPTSKY